MAPTTPTHGGLQLEEGSVPTFTFGGLRVDGHAQVLDHDAAKIAGLYAAGEMVGGIFYFNYPSGAGLVSGAVFGRLAGASAARSHGRT